MNLSGSFSNRYLPRFFLTYSFCGGNFAPQSQSAPLAFRPGKLGCSRALAFVFIGANNCADCD